MPWYFVSNNFLEVVRDLLMILERPGSRGLYIINNRSNRLFLR